MDSPSREDECLAGDLKCGQCRVCCEELQGALESSRADMDGHIADMEFMRKTILDPERKEAKDRIAKLEAENKALREAMTIAIAEASNHSCYQDGAGGVVCDMEDLVGVLRKALGDGGAG